MTISDSNCHGRRRESRIENSEFRREYDLVRSQVEQVDAVIRQLDELRIGMGLSKADLARSIGKDPAVLRRLFTAEVNPELKTVAAIASVLCAEVRIVPKEHHRNLTGERREPDCESRDW